MGAEAQRETEHLHFLGLHTHLALAFHQIFSTRPDSRSSMSPSDPNEYAEAAQKIGMLKSSGRLRSSTFRSLPFKD
jgi:hypothetical protein